jgi:hypothetical protein
MDFADKTGVLAQLWLDFREDEKFEAFVDYNDIGLPMAYYVAQGLVKDLTPLGEQYIEESFRMLIELLNITEDDISILPDQNLGAILVFAYNKKKANEAQEE